MAKHTYLTFLGCIILISASTLSSFAGPRRFAKSEANPPKRHAIAKHADENGIWRPLKETHFTWDGKDWAQNATVDYEYDDRGNTTLQTIWEDGEGYRTAFTYDDLNRKTSELRSDRYEGEEEFLDFEYVTYAYDDIVKDFVTERMNYDWDGEEWIPNYKSLKNAVARNADGNIKDVTMELPLWGEFVPAYRSAWTYGDDGKASAFAYDWYDVNESPADWKHWGETTYRDIIWDRTDGQMTGHINELCEGANRISSATVYFENEPDGYLLVSYPNGDEADYVMDETGMDKKEIWRQHKQIMKDSNGLYVYVTNDFYDDNGNHTITPYYIYEYDAAFNEHGDIISEYTRITENNLKSVLHTEYSYEYNDMGCITRMQIDEYEGSDGMTPTTLIVYSDFIDAAASEVTSVASAANAPEYYSIDGRRIQNPKPGSIVIVRIGAKASKVIM